MQKIADEAGLELRQNLDANTPQQTKIEVQDQMEDSLNERLRALRS
jgi:division protein CdvB (Snf7/Vps24/ESCRT-III family)